jgi:hypothetical protein
MCSFRLVGIALICTVSACFAAPATAPALPTTEEIHARFDLGDYTGVLRDLNHVLSLGGKAIEGYDKHELLTLRGETHLRLKQTDAAAAAFRQAAKATDDPQKSNVDLATEILIHRSAQLAYTPKIVGAGEKHTPISIIEPDNRKLAFRAVFNDEWAAAAPSLKTAKASYSLVVIASAVKTIQSRQLGLLDTVANGNDDQTKQTITGLRDHAAELMSKALEKLGKREQEITSAANEIVHQQVMQQGPFGLQPSDLPRRRGLQGTDRQDLTGIGRTATQIGAAAREIVGGLGDKSAADDLAEQANDIVQRAKKALEADYSHA